MKSVSPAILEKMGTKHHDLDLSGSCDVIGHVTILLTTGHFLSMVYQYHCNVFPRYSASNIMCS